MSNEMPSDPALGCCTFALFVIAVISIAYNVSGWTGNVNKRLDALEQKTGIAKSTEPNK